MATRLFISTGATSSSLIASGTEFAAQKNRLKTGAGHFCSVDISRFESPYISLNAPSSANREVAAVSRSVQYITAPRIKELFIYLQVPIVLTFQSRSSNYLPPRKTSLFPNSPCPQ